jgi:hypothetical protein
VKTHVPTGSLVELVEESFGDARLVSVQWNGLDRVDVRSRFGRASPANYSLAYRSSRKQPAPDL